MSGRWIRDDTVHVANKAHSANLAVIISYLTTSVSGMTVFLKIPQNRENFIVK